MTGQGRQQQGRLLVLVQDLGKHRELSSTKGTQVGLVTLNRTRHLGIPGVPIWASRSVGFFFNLCNGTSAATWVVSHFLAQSARGSAP